MRRAKLASAGQTSSRIPMAKALVVMATHSPMLMAYPNARLLRLSKYGLEPVTVEQTDHYKVMREFCNDPAGFVEAVVEE